MVKKYELRYNVFTALKNAPAKSEKNRDKGLLSEAVKRYCARLGDKADIHFDRVNTVVFFRDDQWQSFKSWVTEQAVPKSGYLTYPANRTFGAIEMKKKAVNRYVYSYKTDGELWVCTNHQQLINHFYLYSGGEYRELEKQLPDRVCTLIESTP